MLLRLVKRATEVWRLIKGRDAEYADGTISNEYPRIWARTTCVACLKVLPNETLSIPPATTPRKNEPVQILNPT